MNKVGKGILIGSIVFFVAMFFLIFLIGGDAVNYEITDYVANVEISEDGDAYVKEYMVIDGSLNGFANQFYTVNPKLEGEESIYNPRDINSFVVGTFEGKVTEGLEDIEYLERVPYAESGDDGVYTIAEEPTNYEVKIYHPSDKETFTIYMEYKLDDVVVVHNDVAEFYYNFFSQGFNDDIDNVEINISLPNSSQEFRYFGHGGLQGTITGRDQQFVKASMTDYMAHSDLDIRVVFDPNIIRDKSSLVNTNKNYLDNILEIEEERALEANQIREELKRNDHLFRILDTIYLIGLIGVFAYIYFKYDREYQSSFNSKYNREFIDDYDVEIVDYLMNEKLSPNALSASIMNLIYKKKITVEKIEEKKYVFKLNNRDNLSDSETILIDFLFKDVGKDDSFTMEDLKKYAEGTKTYSSFNSNYIKWQNSVYARGAKEGFFEQHYGAKVFGVIYGVIGIFLFINSINHIYSTSIFGLLIIPVIILIIYSLVFNKRTKKGNEHYKRWVAFKNFLNDFGNFEVKDLPEIALWERYLVYAVVFGLADKVNKVMNVKIQEFQEAGLDIGDMIFMNYYLNINPIVTRSVTNSINAATRTAAAQAAANSSSSGGFGGGFSSGGGFGGGGRGGGGF